MKRYPNARRSPTRRHRSAGFTLVEVLVALFAMALLSAMAWRGLDSVMRSRDAARDIIDDTVRLSTVLAQWDQDLAALHDTLAVPALQFDGQTLRLTRRNDTGVSLVTWALRGGAWQRWISPPYTRQADLQRAWQQSQQFLGNEPGQLAVARGATEWQLYFFRTGGWSNAQSSGDFRIMTPQRVTPAAAAPAPAAGTSPPSETGPTAGGTTVPAVPAGSAMPVGPEGAAAADAAAAARGAQATAPPGSPMPAQPVVVQQLPDAVRLVITLRGRKLTRDVLLGPASS